LTTFPIAHALERAGYASALTRYGVLFGIVGMLAAQGLRNPDPTWLTFEHQRTYRAGVPSPQNFAPWEMLRTPIFWVMFAMMTMMSTSGLMVISQMGAFTKDFGMASVLVLGLPVLPLALSIDRVTNGATRPFFGWVSDRIGRENTMVIAFVLEGVAMTIWLLTRRHPQVFVLMSGVVFFGWGEIFSLFPSTLTDTYGPRDATTNYGFLYIAQGVGSVLGGPMAALLHQHTGSWTPVFELIVAMNFATASLAQFVLKPMRRRWFDSLVETRALRVS
jgi:MFS family permease